MTNSFTNPADLRPAGSPLHVRIVALVLPGVAAAMARARHRHAYRQMLEREDHVLADMGLSRRDVRQALLDCGGHLETRPATCDDRS